MSFLSGQTVRQSTLIPDAWKGRFIAVTGAETIRRTCSTPDGPARPRPKAKSTPIRFQNDGILLNFLKNLHFFEP